MGWLSKLLYFDKGNGKSSDGLWTKCGKCQEMIYTRELKQNLSVCPKCDYHFRIDARTRISQIFDRKTFTDYFPGIFSVDPLKFKDTETYEKRLLKAREKTGLSEGVVTGRGKISGYPAFATVLDFNFLGGSMGSAIGEKITLCIEKACEERMPMIHVTISGGARMQEGILSLMQMAKTAAAMARLSEHGVMSISLLSDPTTGGVTASYSTLSDILLAEPHALIGFAGPRVIEQTMHQKLPEGFQRSEFLQNHGMLDMIVERKRLKGILTGLLKFYYESRKDARP